MAMGLEIYPKEDPGSYVCPTEGLMSLLVTYRIWPWVGPRGRCGSIGARYPYKYRGTSLIRIAHPPRTTIGP